jgi:hypothetical protein
MKVRTWIAIFLVAAVGTLAAAACSNDDSDGSALRASPPPGTGAARVELTQSNNQGGVEIDVTWVTPETLDELDSEPARAYELDDYVLLEVQFTTHSGDLNQLDMTGLSAIRAAGKEYAPEAWESISDDSHHRAGVLVFARKTPDGASLDAGAVELVMKGIADVPERVFRWQWPVRSG